MDNSIADVAASLYRLLEGKRLTEGERSALERYFRRFAYFPSGQVGSGEWIDCYRNSVEASQLLLQWQSSFGAQAQLTGNEAAAEHFIRSFLQGASQARRTASGGRDIFCGETLTEQNNVLDYATQHAAASDQWVLHLTTEGQCLLSGEQQQLIGTSQLVLLPPGYHCEYQRAPGCPRWVHRWVRFTPRPDWLTWSQSLRQPDQLQVLSLDAQQLRSVQQAFADLLPLASRPGDTSARMQYNRIEYLLLLGAESRGEQQTLDPRVQQAMAYIEQNFTRAWALETLAQLCHLSSARFAALFKQQLAVSPMQWRDQLRIREARRLLLCGNEAIAKVSEAVGYDDQLHFSRRFKQMVGLSPRQYRQRMGN